MSDRRSHPRYDVVGSLWGVLELSEEARILNVSETGALLDSPSPVALDSTQIVRLAVEGHGVSVEARVRHVRQELSGRPAPHYIIGLEFVSPPLSVLQSIEQMSGNVPLEGETEVSQ